MASSWPETQPNISWVSRPLRSFPSLCFQPDKPPLPYVNPLLEPNLYSRSLDIITLPPPLLTLALLPSNRQDGIFVFPPWRGCCCYWILMRILRIKIGWHIDLAPQPKSPPFLSSEKEKWAKCFPHRESAQDADPRIPPMIICSFGLI